MQNIFKSIQLSIVAILISTTVSSQSIESYTCKLSPNLLDGGKVYVKNLVNTGSDDQTFGKSYANKLINVFNYNALGKRNGIKLYNPWLTTKIYQIVSSENEADYIFSGEYKFETGQNKSYEEKWIAETSETVEKKLPICYYSFSAGSSASLTGKLVVNKGTDEIKSFPFSDKKVDNKTTAMSKPTVENPSSFISTLAKDAINKFAYSFSPQLTVYKYKFKNVKTKDKEYKKELKGTIKQIKTLIKTGEVKSVGKKYTEIASKENNENVNYNIAVCYELIGNYTKAKEHYVNSADAAGLNRINDMIKVRDKLKTFGIEVIEDEF